MARNAVPKLSPKERIKHVGVTAAASLLGVVLMPRQRAYRRLLSYNPKQVSIAGFGGSGVETIRVRCHDHGFALPDLEPDVTSAFLQLEVSASGVGELFDPAIEIEAPQFRDTQFLDRGVRGIRLLNVTRLLRISHFSDRWVGLHGRHLGWRVDSAYLHISREKLSGSDRVLVIAPHPDDAEIAAFGVYADTNATIVTLTAGDQTGSFGNSRSALTTFTPAAIARMRVWDSITIPQFGGVSPQRAINLCFPDTKLADMRAQPGRDFRDAFDGPRTFAALRRLNLSEIISDDTPCTWKSLVADLANIIAKTKPRVIVVPHPWLDPQSDHIFSTLAVCEAIESVGMREGRMFLYWVHNRLTELWPFGPAGTGVAMLPIALEDGSCGTGFYSHALSIDRQRDKFLALESMHDIREMELPDLMSLRGAGRRLRGEVRRLIYGMGRMPTTYLRRAVRPDEVFLVMSVTDAIAYARRVAEKGAV
jgi:LmbE family N-acetylglucosaminyl deacetylase